MATTPKGYTSKTAVENYILQDIDSTFTTQLNEWIAGIESIIDKITGRNFKADSAASARLYDGDGSSDLLIDDCIAITKMEVGNDAYGSSFSEVPETGSDRYFLEPVNHAARSIPVFLISLSARCFPEGKQNNRITAKWGYSATPPDDIKFAATVFVAGVLNQHRQGGDEIKSEKIGNYQVTYNTDSGENTWADFTRAMQILDSYRKLNI